MKTCYGYFGVILKKRGYILMYPLDGHVCRPRQPEMSHAHVKGIL